MPRTLINAKVQGAATTLHTVNSRADTQDIGEPQKAKGYNIKAQNLWLGCPTIETLPREREYNALFFDETKEDIITRGISNKEAGELSRVIIRHSLASLN